MVAKPPAFGGRFSVLFFALRAQARFNMVDATYRSDLRETNELNFARFMATVDQRFAEQDAKIQKGFAAQDATFEKRFSSLEIKIERRFSDLLKWMFIYWTGTMLAMAGFVFAMLQRK